MKNIQKIIQSYLTQVVAEEKERGIQVAVYYEGELIVNAYAGYADLARKKLITDKTLFPVFSVGKGMAATVIHILASQGKIEYDAPLAKYWPEFGVKGKKNITVRQVLNHTAGLQNMPKGLNCKDLSHWASMVKLIEKQKPISVPGSQFVYHGITYSWLVGELAQRVDGRKFSAIMDATICQSLKIHDMYIGLPKKLDANVAILDEPNPDPEMLKTKEPHPIPAWICPLADWMNTLPARHACLPSSNGIMTAHAIARHYAALIPGGVDGIELLPRKSVKLATQKQKQNDGTSFHRGLGYSLGGEKSSIYGPRVSAFGHGGYGGSVGFADPHHKFAVGLTKNFFSKENTSGLIVKKIREIIQSK